MARISIENVHKNYGDVEALKPFSLEIADGEFVVLVGPSGCGKSTMLKILAGLEPASGGRVMLGERDVTDVAPGDRDVAMVFQNYALYPHMSVRNNMSYSLRLKRVAKPEISERVSRSAGILGLGDLLDRQPKQLSGGQRQRASYSTSRSAIWMRRFACRCGPKSRRCTSAWGRPSSMSPMIRWKP